MDKLTDKKTPIKASISYHNSIFIESKPNPICLVINFKGTRFQAVYILSQMDEYYDKYDINHEKESNCLNFK